MVLRGVEFHPQASDEARAVFGWYEALSPLAARARFVGFDRAIELIGKAPKGWPHAYGVTRRFLMQHLPPFIVVHERDEIVQVLTLGVGGRARESGRESAEPAGLEREVL